METVDIDPENAHWKIGPNGIRVEDLFLAGLEQVRPGTLRVRLFYKPYK